MPSASPLNIPRDTSKLGGWAKELVTACHASLESRRQRGAIFRNLYLSGTEDGTPQTYKKIYGYIQTLAATLYSPAGLRFAVSPYGPAGPRERAMGHAASHKLLEFFRSGRIDTIVEDAVEWGLVKGKTFIQLEWDRGGLVGHMVQPETMGVYRDDITSLDRQDAFVHSTWLTPTRFADLVAFHPKRAELTRDISKLISDDNSGKPDTASNARQVVIGGQLYPFRQQGSTGAGQGRGLVNWLTAPTPELNSETQNELIRLDELWVWDRQREDWTTIQVVADKIIEPTMQFRNLFAEGDPQGKGGRRMQRGEAPNKENPLQGHHPFCEICPNPMPDYMWGWSEVFNVAMLQLAINNRVDGINRLLRKQEDPSWLIAGVPTQAAKLRATLRRPGGYHTEAQAGNIKIERMSPDLPAGLWESLHELEQMFDQMGGFPPVMQGQGEAGVRAQGHAETLVRMASPRFKDRALGVERQIEEVGGLALDLLRAHVADQFPFWVNESEVGPFKGKELDPLLYEAPAPGKKALPFQLIHVADHFKVTVDSHSSSPVFAHDTRELALILAQRGALGPEDLIRMLHPAGEEELIAGLETRNANKAAMINSLPPTERIRALTGHAPGRGQRH